MFEEIYKILNYEFKNEKLLQEALTHPSMSYSKKKERFNYERLEFLGDSILSCVIIEYLFKKHLNETEGELSKRKAFLVSKYVLYNVAKKLGIGKFIILSNGEEHMGGRENINNLENIMESIIGAIFLDSNFDTVKNFILGIWINLDEKEITVPKDSKTELQEWTQKKFKTLPKYNILINHKDSMPPKFVIELIIPKYKSIQDTGKSIKETKNKLATKMLEIINNKI